MLLLLIALLAVMPLNDDVDSFKLQFNELLFKWSSRNFLTRSLSSRLFLRNLARRFLNQTWREKKRRQRNKLITFSLLVRFNKRRLTTKTVNVINHCRKLIFCIVYAFWEQARERYAQHLSQTHTQKDTKNMIITW